MAFLYLLIAVIAEVLATSALKATNGFTAPLPIVLTIVGYAIALFFLGQRWSHMFEQLKAYL